MWRRASYRTPIRRESDSRWRRAPRSPSNNAAPTTKSTYRERFARGSAAALWANPCGAIRPRLESPPRRSLRQHGRNGAAGIDRHGKRTPIGRGVAAHGDHLRGHGNGDLFRRNGADIEAHGRVNALERLARHAFPLQLADDVDHFALAADHGNVARLRGHGQLEHAHIVAVAARHNDHVAALIDDQLGENFFVLFGVYFGGFGETLAVGERLAVVYDHRRESGESGHLGETLRDMPGAEDKGVRDGQHRFDEDIQLAAADQAVIVGRVLTQVEGEMLRLLRFDNLPRRVPHFGLDAAAADGARHGAVFAHQKLGAFVTGDGAAHVDNGRQRAFLAQIAEAEQLFVYIHYTSDYSVGG